MKLNKTFVIFWVVILALGITYSIHSVREEVNRPTIRVIQNDSGAPVPVLIKGFSGWNKDLVSSGTVIKVKNMERSNGTLLLLADCKYGEIIVDYAYVVEKRGRL